MTLYFRRFLIDLWLESAGRSSGGPLSLSKKHVLVAQLPLLDEAPTQRVHQRGGRRFLFLGAQDGLLEIVEAFELELELVLQELVCAADLTPFRLRLGEHALFVAGGAFVSSLLLSFLFGSELVALELALKRVLVEALRHEWGRRLRDRRLRL